MKKLLSFVLSLTLFFSLTVTAAAKNLPKAVDVSLTASALTVYTGTTVNLTATTVKHGSDYTDSWSGAQKAGTVPDEATGSYISTATFSSDTPGTYTITYSIDMTPGKSSTLFKGTNSIQITVVAPGEVRVTNFEITKWYRGSQDNGNDKDALYITQLKVYYSDGTNGLVNYNYKVGNAFTNPERKFEVPYGGIIKEFSVSNLPEQSAQS